MIVKYPNSISEAAKILDVVDPNWTKKITKNILMWSGGNCILGQLYGNYNKGMVALFGLTFTNIDPNPYTNDTIFGTQADKDVWKSELESRVVKEVEYRVEGLGVRFQSPYSSRVKTGMMARFNDCYYLSMASGNQWSDPTVPIAQKVITKSRLETLYNITIVEIFPATFELVKK